MKKERITFLDGLRGFACLGVFTHHFFLSFFPASYFGAEAAVMTASGFDASLSVEPYSFFVNGNFWVCLFLVISAFLVSNKIFQLRTSYEAFQDGASDGISHKKERQGGQMPVFETLSATLLKRYLRLMIPAALIGIFSYFLRDLLTLTGLNYLGKVNDCSFPSFLYHAVVHMWIFVDSSVQGPFWMLHYLLFGSYLAILIALATPLKNRWTPLIHLFLAVVLGILNHYYIAIVLGVMICYLYYCRTALQETSDHGILNKLMTLLIHNKTLRFATGMLLLLAGLFLGAYPSYVKPDNIYRVFNAYAFRDPDAYELIHSVAAACLLASFFLLKELADFFSTKPLLFLGKLSFSIYLVHSMLLEHLGYYIMHKTNDLINNYSFAGILTYLILFYLLIPLSLACYYTVERFGNWVCGKLFGSKQKSVPTK
ncbi:MAG: acyltransferase [Lachnospiraceae bacterium]|nr:acyltransferase [Lachnospiraceae bacterium]